MCLILPLILLFGFIDFLKDRQQRVCVQKVMAPFLPVNQGVPKALFWGLYFLLSWLMI